MNRSIALLAVALSLAPIAAHAADWIVDPAASTIAFSGTQLGAPFTGHFKQFSATISFDPAHPEAGHAVVLVDTASAATGDVQRDEALPQADWFDAKTIAQARFEATRFVAKGGDTYDAVGSLTIRNAKRDVTLPFKLTIAGGKAHAVGHLQLVRTDFGVGQGDWATPQWVALEVGVDIDVTAHQ
ncbi:YceI family protein [Beijerinckia sp. L45]|uniref:YceI family protein n=1 Tax=Beijerinckia sp. L45 TaxID=1641855 RepID=UPI00131D50AB|nr:YceI family protein [Beijerinckia sp. L45]